jgi:hypothetical protein
MRSILIYILSNFILELCTSQTVEVLKSIETTKLPSADNFDFIDEKTDSINYSFVATYKAVGKDNKSGIDAVFFKLSNTAKYDGATCFKINSFSQNDSLNETILILDAYYWNDSIRNINLKNLEQNCIYIFSDDRPNKYHSITFKINNNKKELPSRSYYKYAAHKGERVKINKGGITGMTASYLFEDDRPDIFLTLTGFGLGGGALIESNTVGVSFNTGRIYPIDLSLGYLLKSLLKESE